MAMRISWTASAATVFTTFMTLSNVSHVIGNFIAGPLRQLLLMPARYGENATMISYEMTFWLVGVFSILPLAILLTFEP